MTDIRATQIAVEQFASIIPPDMQATQVAIEMWVGTNITNPLMVATMVAAEVWTSVAEAAAGGSDVRVMVMA